MQASGRLYLLPTPLGDNNLTEIIPPYNIQLMESLRYFVVEQIRTARRFLRKAIPSFPIDDCHFFELNEHTAPNFNTEAIVAILLQGHSVGLLSEAGLPCIADPGNTMVMAAQEKGITIIPLVGPSSLLMALMASGCCGQNFAFNGYLPTDKTLLINKIRQIEGLISKYGQTQIFIETPYRNIAMAETLIHTCNADTILCIACDITLPTMDIRSMSIARWKKIDLSYLHKRPAVFVLGRHTTHT
ncbi:MAG: SAM-dependent methyltransferase [Bacteroidales bacterium]|nr:SAM-dependent methyltransferase [Bacteroidales bacterium]